MIGRVACTHMTSSCSMHMHAGMHAMQELVWVVHSIDSSYAMCRHGAGLHDADRYAPASEHLHACMHMSCMQASKKLACVTAGKAASLSMKKALRKRRALGELCVQGVAKVNRVRVSVCFTLRSLLHACTGPRRFGCGPAVQVLRRCHRLALCRSVLFWGGLIQNCEIPKKVTPIAASTHELVHTCMHARGHDLILSHTSCMLDASTMAHPGHLRIRCMHVDNHGDSRSNKIDRSS